NVEEINGVPADTRAAGVPGRVVPLLGDGGGGFRAGQVADRAANEGGEEERDTALPVPGAGGEFLVDDPGGEHAGGVLRAVDRGDGAHQSAPGTARGVPVFLRGGGVCVLRVLRSAA